ncbi:MAG TPA: urea ABC transporter ATP-binding protein UrtD [Egibacteraceae bacterium]|nr:urea ABC transporter ATP-binding protein UrtD [Egibacteraceae bacterium]
MTSTVVDVAGLVVEFDGFPAIDGLDFTVEQGELRFLIGPNGAGKTTLLDVLTGLTRPRAGTATVLGHDVTSMSEHGIVARGIGRTFQTPTVFEELTVAENLDLARIGTGPRRALLRRPAGVPAAMTGMLERGGLLGLAGRPSSVLSHGQRQWLEIAMLLAADPRVLLLDEPVAGMTRDERRATGELLTDIATDRTVVVVEHDMDFLRRYARRVTVMHAGRLLAEGSVADIQAHPRVREVYLGRPADEGAADA